MHMTLQQLLRDKGMSRYQLSKASGIPWATLANSLPPWASPWNNS